MYVLPLSSRTSTFYHIFLLQVDVGDPLQQFARGYEDYLQCPLQPLMDNLESQTYEVFEKDPVKYSEYQTAIQQALTDMVAEEEKDTKVLVLMVVGAGRGPLVRAALNASSKSGRKIRVFAVEKNPNAVVTLQQQQLEMWGDQVKFSIYFLLESFLFLFNFVGNGDF